jgi:hypothetical protein
MFCREKLEKEIKELTALKQKLNKEQRNVKCSTSDSQTILYDLLQLSFDLDAFVETADDLYGYQRSMVEELNQFTTELHKEAKNSSALNPFAQKIVPKVKDTIKIIEGSGFVLEDCDRIAKDMNKVQKSVCLADSLRTLLC